MGQSEKARDAFLDALAQGFPVTKACEATNVARTSVYRWRADDEDFAAAWDLAYEQGTDLLEAEAQRRAVDGIEEHHYDKDGNLLWTSEKYSDTLLIFLLKSRKPKQFARFERVEVTGKNGGPIEHEHKGVSLADIIRVAAESGALGDKRRDG